MAIRQNPKVQLPKKWTNAQVRVNPQGKVQVKIAKNKVMVNSAARRGKKAYSKMISDFTPKPSRKDRLKARSLVLRIRAIKRRLK